MTYNLITFGKKRENMDLAIRESTIGSFLKTFENHIGKGAIVFLHCEGKIWATANVSSEYFYSESVIWADKLYPHRFKISNLNFLKNPIELVNGVYNVELKNRFGSGWAYKFLFSPKPLPEDIALKLLSHI